MLIAATGLTRFAFRSHYLYDLDSVNFALALRRFDPAAHQPHPPGYFLYVCLGRLANLFLHDANSALVAISIVFSCGAAVMVYSLADCWFGRRAAFFAGLIFLFSPLVWFHGTVALTYIVEAFFSALVGYLCWQVSRGAVRFALPAAVATGVAAGFRPSSILFLCPLLFFSLRKSSRRRLAGGMAALVLTTLAWLIPMIRISGAQRYFSALVSLWRIAPGKTSGFTSSIVNSVARAGAIVDIVMLSFGVATLLILRGLSRKSAAERSNAVFTWVWITPGLLFFTFVFLPFVNSGYLLILFPPVCAWAGLWAANWYADGRLPKAAKVGLVVCATMANAAIFLWAPVYSSCREVRKFETELTDIVKALPQIASPRDTMIVGFDSHFLGYRHAGYYLPQYLTVQYPEVRLASGIRVFAMRNRDTRLDPGLAAGSFLYFVLFPLPLGDAEYSDYLTTVRKRFPPGDLRSVARNGHEFVMGPAKDLHFLFPAAAQGELTVHKP
jgi:hypothetical protein